MSCTADVTYNEFTSELGNAIFHPRAASYKRLARARTAKARDVIYYIPAAKTFLIGQVSVEPPAGVFELPQSDLLTSVDILHFVGRFVEASDVLLNKIVDLIEANDFHALDNLIEEMARSSAGACDDNQLARLLNVLALTVKWGTRLPNRQSLADSYRRQIAARFGAEAANDAVSRL